MININLLPPELKMRRIAARRNASLVSVCLLVVIIFAVLSIIARSLESTVATRLNTTKNNIDKEASVLDQYQSLRETALLINDRWQAAQSVSKDRVPLSQVLQELNNSVPIDVQFENLNINIEKTPNFTLQGNTTTEREIIKFKEKLEESSFFRDVAFRTSSLTKGDNEKEVLKFTLEFNLEKSAQEAEGAKEIK